MKVKLSRRANADLKDIARWVGRDDRTVAIRFSAALRRQCESLGLHPAKFPIVGSFGGLELRKRTYKNYLIFYVILDEAVEVVRIMHGAQDWLELLQPPGG